MNYTEFLENKIQRIEQSGFDVSEDILNSKLFNFQKFSIIRALKHGRYAIFADCGNGKTLIELEFATQVVNHTDKPVLILAPLAVVGQHLEMAVNFGYELIEYNSEMYAMCDLPPSVYISNYEQLGNIQTDAFSGIVLDESSILKNSEGAYRNLLIDRFSGTPYKLACTATPSPNDVTEIGNHAEFLNIMSLSEMKAMYFVHDGGNTSEWRLKGHCIKLFWKWVSSWAIMFSKPKDIGFDIEGYELPRLTI